MLCDLTKSKHPLQSIQVCAYVLTDTIDPMQNITFTKRSTLHYYYIILSSVVLGFMQFVVLPLFQEWERFNPSDLSKEMVRNIQINKNNWDIIMHESEVPKVCVYAVPSRVQRIFRRKKEIWFANLNMHKA